MSSQKIQNICTDWFKHCFGGGVRINFLKKTMGHKEDKRLSSFCLNPIQNNSSSSVAQLCPALCDPMDPSTPGLPVHHQLLEFIQTHVHGVGETIQPSHLLCPLLLLPSIFPSIRVFSNELSFSSQVAKALEFQLQSFLWSCRTVFL